MEFGKRDFTGNSQDLVRISTHPGGVVLVPKYSEEGRGTTLVDLGYRVGDSIELRWAEGIAIKERIKGLEHFRPMKDWMPREYGMLIEDHPEILVGMQIWPVRD
jgi:hypothetical protein